MHRNSVLGRKEGYQCKSKIERKSYAHGREFRKGMVRGQTCPHTLLPMLGGGGVGEVRTGQGTAAQNLPSQG